MKTLLYSTTFDMNIIILLLATCHLSLLHSCLRFCKIATLPSKNSQLEDRSSMKTLAGIKYELQKPVRFIFKIYLCNWKKYKKKIINKYCSRLKMGFRKRVSCRDHGRSENKTAFDDSDVFWLRNRHLNSSFFTLWRSAASNVPIKCTQTHCFSARCEVFSSRCIYWLWRGVNLKRSH